MSIAVPAWMAEVADAYQRLMPSGWLAVALRVPVGWGMVLFSAGLMLLFFGSDRVFRVVSVPLGLWIGAVWTGLFLSRLGLGSLPSSTAPVAALVLGTIGLLSPAALVFIAAGMPCAMLGGALVGQSDWLLGALPGFVFGGIFSLIFHRPLRAVVASLLGAWLAMLGALAVLKQVSPLATRAVENPPLALSLVGCAALCGVVFQLVIRDAPELRAQRRLERAQAKKRAKEEEALHRRWSDASWRKKKG
jgi:signal transduction histidine kinase